MCNVIAVLHTTISGSPQVCEFVHEGQSCPQFLANFAVQSYPRSLKLYAIQYLILFFFSKNKDPVAFAKNLLRSALFLTTYCTAAWFTACYFYKVFPGVTRRKLFAHMTLTVCYQLIVINALYRTQCICATGPFARCHAD
jgi:hypothetical protein